MPASPTSTKSGASPLLNLNCTRDRSRCVDKRRHNAVAQVFYLGAAMVFQTPPDDRVVSPEQFHRHRIAELRRHLGRTDHVREHGKASTADRSTAIISLATCP